jgi:hypothetical protein
MTVATAAKGNRSDQNRMILSVWQKLFQSYSGKNSPFYSFSCLIPSDRRSAIQKAQTH